MSDFEIDLDNVTLEKLKAAVSGYSTAYNASFTVQQTGSGYQLIHGEEDTKDVYCTGTLREVAYFWEGYVSGELSGLPDGDDEGL